MRSWLSVPKPEKTLPGGGRASDTRRAREPAIAEDQRRVLGGFGRHAAYEKRLPPGRPWPEDIGQSEIIPDNSLQAEPVEDAPAASLLKRRPGPARSNLRAQEIRRTLTSYLVVPGASWAHEYSHVAGLDQTGWLVSGNAPRLRWLIRPGGLAVVVYPDGGAVFLAREVHTKPGR